MPNLDRRATTAVLAVTLACLATVSGCTTDDHHATPIPVDLGDIHEPPRELTTTVFQGITLPLAAQGPHRRNEPALTGFDHTPAGAALAAIHATVRMSVATDSQWPQIGQQLLAPGPGRDAWAVARAQISLTQPVTTPPKILGYQIARYTPGEADTAIYTVQPDTSLTRNLATVVWRNNDWRLLLPDPPGTPTVTAPLALPADTVILPMR
ncbi:hypothetical protein [Nocardia blacklockiae]|uniref:hypothetical protein n=1 Tax=Nocardia blacklockiae TaxID=480036 RepID=UPI001895AEB6|nr:hypothetical protein [Nocardia blacklockiae]MBF6176052.1 hypothetical protein [Nocardia blacklockiae]